MRPSLRVAALLSGIGLGSLLVRHLSKRKRERSSELRPEDVMTVVVTTSPVGHNPSTEMIQGVLGTFALVPGLVACRTVIVCDGVKITDASNHRQGKGTSCNPIWFQATVKTTT